MLRRSLDLVEQPDESRIAQGSLRRHDAQRRAQERERRPRNAFRGTPRMYDTDAMARKIANTAFAAGYDRSFEKVLQKFFVLPLAHSEDLADQERAVALARRIAPDDLAHAEHHRDIVRRFGRFPHRNAFLDRETTKEEADYLANGGYPG